MLCITTFLRPLLRSFHFSYQLEYVWLAPHATFASRRGFATVLGRPVYFRQSASLFRRIGQLASHFVACQLDGYELLHFGYGFFETNHDGSGDDAVADVEFLDTVNLGDSANVAVSQTVAHVNLQPFLLSVLG